MRRAVVAAVLVAVLAAVPAMAAVRRAKDRKAGVTFRLNAKHLTMKLSDQADPRASKQLLGRRVAAACGTSSTGGKVYDVVFTWPRTRSSVGVDLARDISARVAFCLLENAKSGDDIALVKFH